MTSHFLSGEKLYQDVVAYSSFGDHRTATDGEEKTTDWMAERLTACGLDVSFQTFSQETYFVDNTNLTVDGKEMGCFPLWPPTWTGQTPVRGRLVATDTGHDIPEGSIVLLKPSFSYGAPAFSNEGDNSAIRAAAGAGAIAAVVIGNGPSDGMHAYNTPVETARRPIPVVLTPKRNEAVLVKAAERHAEVSLLLDGTDIPNAQPRNIIAKLNRGDDIIVISTPKSGWFTCAGERGPGVALSLALARWASERNSNVSYLFDANTGHETGGTGIMRFIEELAPSPDRTLAWIHLGANIATWDWEETTGDLVKRARPEDYRVVCSSEELLPLLNTALAELPGLEPRAGRGIGEMREVIRMGYRGFGVNGGPYRYFHTPEDVPEVGTAPELLEPMAAALVRALELLESEVKSQT
ncbi:MAG TPA: hypothetical protein VMW13_03030 [Dehalococcoidales bacterium]|nr:hypothetical protein [Dehalococcoidales bacterium]